MTLGEVHKLTKPLSVLSVHIIMSLLFMWADAAADPLLRPPGARVSRPAIYHV